VLKPGALALARYAHDQDCLALNIGDKTYKWTVQQGWPTPDTSKGFMKNIAWIITLLPDAA